MSLKAFHILFITLAVLMILGCAGWVFSHWLATGYPGSLVAAVLSFLGALLLVAYEVLFLRKSRGLK